MLQLELELEKMNCPVTIKTPPIGPTLVSQRGQFKKGNIQKLTISKEPL